MNGWNGSYQHEMVYSLHLNGTEGLEIENHLHMTPNLAWQGGQIERMNRRLEGVSYLYIGHLIPTNKKGEASKRYSLVNHDTRDMGHHDEARV